MRESLGLEVPGRGPPRPAEYGGPEIAAAGSRACRGKRCPAKYHAPTVSDGGGATVSSSIRVLIVDDEVNVRFAMERRLRKAGMETASASTVRHAMDRVRNDPYDVVLCDLRMPGGNGDELLRWLGAYSPSTKAIVVSAFLTPEFKETFRSGDNLRHLEKPVDLDELVRVIEELGRRRGFYGNAIEVELFDYVQMVALTGRDKLIEVATPRGNGLIWFEHGDIVHVEYAEFRGELAFYHVLSVNRGTFREMFWTDPPKRTVQRSSTHLLMEAARMADEGELDKLHRDLQEADELFAPPPATKDEDESSFESLNSAGIVALDDEPPAPPSPPPLRAPRPKPPAEPPAPAAAPEPGSPEAIALAPTPIPAEPDPAREASTSGHAIFEDPDTRQVMLGQFWQFEGINGVAIISSTGKVLAEDMRSNSSMVTLAGFYMRGAARLARTLGYNVFDGVVARSMNGQQMVMVSMGAASAVLSVTSDHDPEAVRDAVMGVE